MPRGKNNNSRTDKTDPNASRKYFCPPDAAWGGYVNLKVDASERADFDGWQVEESANIPAYLYQATVEGLKLSVSYDASNSACIATFTGAGCHNDAARYCLVARSDNIDEAINLLLYKHIVLLDGDWSSFSPNAGRAVFG